MAVDRDLVGSVEVVRADRHAGSSEGMAAVACVGWDGMILRVSAVHDVAVSLAGQGELADGCSLRTEGSTLLFPGSTTTSASRNRSPTRSMCLQWFKMDHELVP